MRVSGGDPEGSSSTYYTCKEKADVIKKDEASDQQKKMPPHMCAISYSQLLDFHKKASEHYGSQYSKKTMRDIVNDIIIPRCEETKTSYSQYLNPQGLKATAFITHSWDEPFPQFVESIVHVYQTAFRKPNFWICSFAIIQGDEQIIEDQIGSTSNVEDSPFVQVIKNVNEFVVVRNDTVDLYERIWCVCELIFAKKAGLVPNKTYVTGPNKFAKNKASVLDAKATKLGDRDRILKVLLNEHNRDDIDKIVEEFRTYRAEKLVNLPNSFRKEEKDFVNQTNNKEFFKKVVKQPQSTNKVFNDMRDGSLQDKERVKPESREVQHNQQNSNKKPSGDSSHPREQSHLHQQPRPPREHSPGPRRLLRSSRKPSVGLMHPPSSGRETQQPLGSRKPTTVEKRDILTVFQADPLVFESSGGGQCETLERVDFFEAERDNLNQSVKEAVKVGGTIDVKCEAATVDRLCSFFDTGEGRALHFAAYGHPKYLMIENGWGAGVVLTAENLRRRVSEGRTKLDFVFVSAYQANSAGKTFVKAGVPHVVCCQHDKSQVNNAATNLFVGAFYRELSRGATIKQAFEVARRQGSQNRMDKQFTLLPEDGNHNVPVFFTSNAKLSSPSPRHSILASPRALPPTPEVFVGRELDMYHILDALKSSRLVRVTGSKGIGKSSLAKAAVQYINKRHILDKIIWLPDFQPDSSGGDTCVRCCSKLVEEFWSNKSATIFKNDALCREYRRKIASELSDKTALIVIDARDFQVHDEGIKKICIFLEALLQETRFVKVIVIQRYEGEQIISNKFPCVEKDVDIHQLDCEATVKLFGSVCQYVSSPLDLNCLRSLLVPPANETAPDRLSNFSARIFKQLGEGFPAKIHRAAKTMNQSEYNKLIALGSTPDFHATFASRAALEERLTQLAEEAAQAIRTEDFERAGQIEATLNQLELLREELHDLVTIKTLVEQVQSEIRIAVELKDYDEAAALKKQLLSLKEKMKVEVEATVHQIELQPEAHIDQETLNILVEELQAYKRAAIKSKNNSEVTKLECRLELLDVYSEAKIVLEEESPENTEIEPSPSNDPAETSSPGNQKFSGEEEAPTRKNPPPSNYKTRANLEDSICKLEKELKEALNNRNYHKVETIDRRIEHLKSRRKALPTKSELKSVIKKLNVNREEIIERRNWKDLRVLDGKLLEFENKLKLEEDAEKDIQGAEDQYPQTVESEQCDLLRKKWDPPGLHASENKAQKRDPPMSSRRVSGQEQGGQQDETETNRIVETKRRARQQRPVEATLSPGAVQVQGSTGDTSEEDDEVDTDTDDIIASKRRTRQQRPAAETLTPAAVRPAQGRADDTSEEDDETETSNIFPSPRRARQQRPSGATSSDKDIYLQGPAGLRPYGHAGIQDDEPTTHQTAEDETERIERIVQERLNDLTIPTATLVEDPLIVPGDDEDASVRPQKTKFRWKKLFKKKDKK